MAAEATTIQHWNPVTVGSNVGAIVGVIVGVIVGSTVGVIVGVTDGATVGVTVGVTVGFIVGVAVGVSVGVTVGVIVGATVGVTVGATVGAIVGDAVGNIGDVGKVMAESLAKDTAAAAKPRPTIVELDPYDMDTLARIVPSKLLDAPIVALEPTAQYMFFASAPFSRIIDVADPVMRLVAVWKIH